MIFLLEKKKRKKNCLLKLHTLKKNNVKSQAVIKLRPVRGHTYSCILRKTEHKCIDTHPETPGAQKEDDAIRHVQLRAITQWDVS